MNFGAFGAFVKQTTCTVELLMLGVERRLEKGVGDLRGASKTAVFEAPLSPSAMLIDMHLEPMWTS
jgi:hypothetical protein